MNGKTARLIRKFHKPKSASDYRAFKRGHSMLSSVDKAHDTRLMREYLAYRE